jgi:predicted MPP superfamily phosphohydrolase
MGIRRRGSVIGSAIGGIIILLLIYSIWIEPYWVEVRHIHVEDLSLNKALKGRTAVHITDLHMEGLGLRENRVLQIINDIKPDFIFLTGDYVSWEGDYEPALEFLSKLKARVGAWAVMGEYDYSSDRKSCLFCHAPGSGDPTSRHNVHFLRNSVERVVIDGKNLPIAGYDGGSDVKERIWPGAGEESAAIVLVHSPLVFDSVKDGKMLVLAGDTHGGQVPFLGWIWKLLGYEKNAKYNYGYFFSGQKKIFVSKGVGTSHLPIRFLCRPEVVVLHF